MAVHGKEPFIKVLDSNGSPIVGAVLKVYDAGTVNLRAIYSDAGLSIAQANPLTGASASNASGDFPRFYMASGTYKLRAETSAGVLIWEYDNIDTALSAGAGALPIASGGTGATTAAAARAALDVPSNSELADLAADIAAVTASLQALIGQPQGYLTPTSGTPVIITGVTAGTAVYYTPLVGTQIPIFDGTIFNIKTFAELTLALHANHLASAIYDVFVFEDSGVITIGTGPAWNTATAGAGARGAGAGTTELVRQGGIWVNTNSMTARNGATTYTVDAKEGTYVGSIFMDGTNGQNSCLTAYGASRKWGVWNAYNRKPICLQVGDTTASWTYAGTTVRPSNNLTTNSATVFAGLPEERVFVDFLQNISSNTAGSAVRIGIGFNSTTAFTAFAANNYMPNAATSGLITTPVRYIASPFIGINVITCLENFPVASGVGNFNGGSDDMLMTLAWMG